MATIIHITWSHKLGRYTSSLTMIWTPDLPSPTLPSELSRCIYNLNFVSSAWNQTADLRVWGPLTYQCSLFWKYNFNIRKICLVKALTDGTQTICLAVIGYKVFLKYCSEGHRIILMIFKSISCLRLEIISFVKCF